MKISHMSVELIDSMGNDLSVCNAARVSFAKESDWVYSKVDPFNEYSVKTEGSDIKYQQKYLSEKDQKLVSYLANHGHWTPFAHAFLSFRIKAPIFVARQLVKHQVGLAWNEVSRRYVDDEPELWFPKVWRGKPTGNIKQGSEGEWHDTEIGAVYEQLEDLVTTYNFMIRRGCAPEMARMILPQNTMTEWIWSGSLAAFARVCKLRLDPHAQQETREVAEKINALVPKEFEHSWKALLS